MPKLCQIKNGPALTIEDKCFASGGEGDLYRILQPISHKDFVVKLFKPEKLTLERERKVEFLSSNIPEVKTADGHRAIIWIEKPVYQAGKFIGFVMPLAKGEKLELLCNPKLPQKLGREWQKFDFSQPNALELRRKICYNIAVAVYQIQSLKKYVLVDMKPENIMIQSDGLISIIDTDSVQVVSNGRVIFAAPVVTPEYTPPEYYRGVKPEKSGADETWDLFSLAVIFYRLLCGIHPFIGTCHPPFADCNGFDAKIERGLFPNGRSRSRYKVIPSAHENFRKLSSGIQQLFIRCFDDGHDSANSRPSLEEWCGELVPGAIPQSHRPLPSTCYSFPDYKRTGSFPIIAKPAISFPRIVVPELPDEGVVSRFLGFFRRTSTSEILKAEFRKKQRRLREMIASELQFTSQIEQILAAYEIDQRNVIEREEIDIQALRNSFYQEFQKIDQSAKNIIAQEAKEKQDLYGKINTEIQAFKSQIASLHDSLLGTKTSQYNSHKLTYEASLLSLENQKATDTKAALSNLSRLSKYTIAPAAREIFGNALPNVISNLQKNFIFSAADFISVNLNGEIRKAAGGLIKIAGLGPQRATMLNDWRKRVESMEDNIIRDRIVQTQNEKIREAAIVFSKYEYSWKQQIQPAQSQFDVRSKELNSKIQEQQGRYKDGLTRIVAIYDDLLTGSVRQSEVTLKQYQEDIKRLQQAFAQEIEINREHAITALNDAVKFGQTLIQDIVNKANDLARVLSQIER